MQLRINQLQNDLKRGLRPAYLISGDEPLQAQEAADAIRQACRQQGYEERELLHAGSGFDWSALYAAADSLSLFSSKKIIDLRLGESKPGKDGGAALRDYCQRPPEDTVLLISSKRLDQASLKTAWVKALDTLGAHLRIWPIDAQQLPQWIGQRLSAQGLRADPDGLRYLAEQVEGNLLAAAQEIDKLALLHREPNQPTPRDISFEHIQQAIANSARYNVWGLIDQLLRGQAGQAQHMLEGLKAEGVAPPAILWAIANETRRLAALEQAQAQGQPLDPVFKQLRVFEKNKAALNQALRRLKRPRIQRLAQRCAQADRIIKGQAPGRPWDALTAIVADFSRTRTRPH